MRSRRTWGWTPNGRRWFAILGLFLVHIIWIALGRNPGQRLQSFLDVLAKPTLAAARLWEGWREGRRLHHASLGQARTELIQTKARLEALEIQQAQQAPRLAEADEAIRLLGLKQSLPLEFRAARVVANLRKAPFGGLVLDATEGLKPDQGVIAPEGVVGRIWSIGLNQSTVLPLDAYNASTAVMLGRSRATGILQGVAPNRAEIRYIGSQEVVQVGEPVYTSGLDRVFPRGLLVGWVTAFTPLDVELRIEVSLAAPLDRLSLVLILPPSPQLELPPPAEPPRRAGGHP